MSLLTNEDVYNSTSKAMKLVYKYKLDHKGMCIKQHGLLHSKIKANLLRLFVLLEVPVSDS